MIISDHAITVSDKADDRISHLNGLGFVWDVEQCHFQKVIDTLLHHDKYDHDYERTNNNNNEIKKAPTKCVARHNATLNHKCSWGFQLVSKCCATRNKDSHNVKNRIVRR